METDETMKMNMLVKRRIGELKMNYIGYGFVVGFSLGAILMWSLFYMHFNIGVI